MLKNARRAQILGALVVAGACGVGLCLGQGDASLVREALAAPTSPTVPPPPPGGGGTMPSTYVAPTTGIIDTVVPSSAVVSYQVISDSPEVVTANVKYTEDGAITGFAPVALPWTKPVAVAPPLSIVTVYATLPQSPAVADPEGGGTQADLADATIRCRVLVNGAVVKEDSAKGPNATATCSVSVNVDSSLPAAPAPSGAPGAPAPSAAPAVPPAPAVPGEPRVTTLAPPAPAPGR
ncbi:conserved hypothetical protein [Segniliparus rotundus DSM 44985]|uniref:Uncharacterized protein n=1 Tax=Segniliparus rotundus (strain ATCC BAA-972 / CDC 1076 / CIP 108378 / DSM 44985 / JCM 13578) TaxID=640132 RepID=D6ZCM5_SEGRD|nr:hypothetical protein [Segniliparus rotundus]ADG97067.1 conserved hypothetical protein [Segniliparus rotundus DSM 44985]